MTEQRDHGATAVALPSVAPPGSPRLRRDAMLRRMLAVADLGAIAAALALATPLAVTASATGISRIAWELCTLPAWIVVSKAYGLSARAGKGVSHSTVDAIPW